MGAVYKARQKGLERLVALKILHAEVASAPGFSERFAREARTLAALQHENLVTVHEFGQAGPWCYLVMELVDGVDLRHLMAERAVAPREALSIVAQVCDALQYAHDQGVVHRDIKPENISGRPARAGAHPRLRPLQAGRRARRRGADARRPGDGHAALHGARAVGEAADVDHRADIYSLGVVFYELLTGELPVGRFEPPSHRAWRSTCASTTSCCGRSSARPSAATSTPARSSRASRRSGARRAASASAAAVRLRPAAAGHRRVPHGVWWGSAASGLLVLLIVPLFLDASVRRRRSDGSAAGPIEPRRQRSERITERARFARLARSVPSSSAGPRPPAWNAGPTA
jgi:serine/threonine protein kinase